MAEHSSIARIKSAHVDSGPGGNDFRPFAVSGLVAFAFLFVLWRRFVFDGQMPTEVSVVPRKSRVARFWKCIGACTLGVALFIIAYMLSVTLGSGERPYSATFVLSCGGMAIAGATLRYIADMGSKHILQDGLPTRHGRKAESPSA